MNAKSSICKMYFWNKLLFSSPMDMRFSAFDCSALVGDQEPEELQYYSSALQT